VQAVSLRVSRNGAGKSRGVRKRIAELVARWPVARQLEAGDVFGRNGTAMSPKTEALHPRTEDADRVVRSICPYCAVGCGQRVYVQDEQITDIEGDPDSPISRGRLCPKGAATRSLVTGDRLKKVLYRRPYAREWEELALEDAMDMIADRIIATRADTWEERDDQGRLLRRTLGFAHLGGATLDNEENYLIKKGFSALGAVAIENQARI
jgi:formate dehydrogenase major subunit